MNERLRLTPNETVNITEWLAARGISEIESVFPDINGFPRGKIQRAADFGDAKEIRIAQAIITQTINGDYPDDTIIGEIDEDARLIPDLSTARHLPWAPNRAWIIHDCVNFDDTPSMLSCRNVLKRVLAQYAVKGLHPVVAPEIEFYLFARDGNEAAGFQFPPLRGGCRETGQFAYSIESSNELAPFWADLNDTLEKLCIRTDTWLHEMGPSQFEINLFHGEPLAKADEVVLFKYAVREVAARHALYAVFMAKPLSGKDGSSMHLHQSIVDTQGQNIFSQPDGEASTAFYAFIGGLQHHLPEMMPLFAPHLNSWRRYVRGMMAPINMEWGNNNRTIALRVPHSDPQARRVENRIAGSDANPYLIMAASLGAGLLGMEQSLKAREPVHDESGYSRPREIPKGLESALEKLHGSIVARALLSDLFVDVFCSVKDVELDSFMNEVSHWDRRFLTLQV
jgi:glutamine synthetase